MDIALSDETGRLQEKHEALMEKLIIASAEEISIDQDFELSIIMVNNKKIQEMNKNYRSVDEPTDVISFALEDNDEDDFADFFDSEDSPFPRILGDIIISIDQLEAQAKEYGHSFERELGFLVVHGFLHLNGYDHQTEEEEKKMFALQEKILKENDLER